MITKFGNFIKENNMNIGQVGNVLDIVYSLQQKLLATNSKLAKEDILKEFIEGADPSCKTILDFILDKHIKFGITSALFEDIMPDDEQRSFDDNQIIDIFTTISSKNASAKDMKQMLIDLYKGVSPGAREIIKCIVDKDFRCGVNASKYNSIVNKDKELLGVALANKYSDKANKVDFKKDVWYVSRKLDGCRLNIIKQGDNVQTLSRQGNEFTTLDKLKECIQQIPGDFVLDGEVITSSGLNQDNFKEIVSQVKRKDYTIPDPVMMVFDIYSPDVAYGRSDSKIFSQRYEELKKFFADNKNILGDKFVMVEQKKVESEDMLNDEYARAKDSKWEGLMIRKDVKFEGKRTDNLLKIKGFEDGEYKIIGYELGDFRYKSETLHNVLASVTIDYKGNEVKVGSGWSLEERKALAKNPEVLIGRTLKIKYFEETKNAKGGVSLRFPTKVFLYDGERFD